MSVSIKELKLAFSTLRNDAERKRIKAQKDFEFAKSSITSKGDDVIYSDADEWVNALFNAKKKIALIDVEIKIIDELESEFLK